IEVDPASLRSREASASSVTSAAAPSASSVASPVAIRGEVVDSKCFLGVMVPGSGKTHKDCASLCVRGGIPPAVYVKDRSGTSAFMLLTRVSGEPVNEAAIAVAAEAIDMAGTVERRGG